MARRRKPVDLDGEVRALTDRFVADLQAVVEQAVTQRTAEAVAQFVAVQGLVPGRGRRSGKPGKGPGAQASARARTRARVSAEEAKEAVYAALQGAGEPVGMSAIKAATGYGPSTIRGAISVLELDGVVGRSGQRRGTVYFTAETQA